MKFSESHVLFQVFKLKAQQLVDRLLPSCNTPTGIPWAMVNLQRYSTNVSIDDEPFLI